MKNSEIFDAFRFANQGARDQNLDSIPLNTLEQFLNEMEERSKKTPEGMRAEVAAEEHYKASLTDIFAQNQRNHETALELFKSVIASSQGAIRAALIINGGAAVAMLGFTGQLWKLQGAVGHQSVAIALAWFAGGVCSAGITAFFAYFSQLFYSNKVPWSQRAGVVSHLAALLTGASSFICFGMGAYNAYWLVSQLESFGADCNPAFAI